MRKAAERKPAPPPLVGLKKKRVAEKVKFADLTAEGRGKRPAVLFDKIGQFFWGGKPETKAVQTLINLRRGEM